MGEDTPTYEPMNGTTLQQGAWGIIRQTGTNGTSPENGATGMIFSGWDLPLWKIWGRQLGSFFPYIMKNKKHVPNHQPVFDSII